MSDIRLIYQVVEWERKLQIEEETRRNLRGEPYTDGFTAASRPAPRERQSIFSRIFGRSRNRSRQPVQPNMTEECCG